MKIAIVTGAAQGVGLATAAHFARTGYHVVMTDLKPLDSQAAQLRAEGGSVSAISGDVSDNGFVRDMVAEVMLDHGAANVLVNNAGISLICPAEATSFADWQRVMAINLTGPFLLSQAVGQKMLERGSGSIVNVASIAGLHGVIHRAAYNASKHGLIGLTRTLAAEWGGRGVRVNAVCPGWIKTEMDAQDMGSGAYGDDDIINRVPMARFASADEVARAIAFLADGNDFINGVSLSVDGGWTADGSWDSLRTKTRQ